MMVKTGYKPDFAGAVEAAASTGGQIMPPIMGAAAFLMAEYTGVPYSKNCSAGDSSYSVIFCWYLYCSSSGSEKLGLKGLDKDTLPKFNYLVRKLYLLTPLVVLVILVSNGTRTMQSSAAIAILVTIIVGLFNSDNRISISKIVDALEAGGKGTITVASACSMAGIVAGCITSTGLASKLLRTIVSASGGDT
ncbi:MAG: TRAP transporter large permease subunit [Clostridium sp.]